MHFSSPSSKNKKNMPQENFSKENFSKESFLYFGKWEPGKNFLYFLKEKLFLYFGKQNFLMPWEMELSYVSGSNFLSLKNKKKINSEKTSSPKLKKL